MKKEAKFIFTRDIKGDSILQLKSGKLIFYYNMHFQDIYIYSEKTFQKLFQINLYQPIIAFEKVKNNDKIKSVKENNYEELNYFKEYEIKIKKNKNFIKELYNGLILFGLNRYLIELYIQDKTYEYKIIKELYTTILDLNVLSDKRIIIITCHKILIIQKENVEYKIKEEYPNKYVLLIERQATKYGYYGSLTPYFSSEELPKNRLILNSLSSQLYFSCGCVVDTSKIYSSKIIIIINLNNFEEI